MRVHLAVDLGAESGRVIAVWIAGQSVEIHELHRFFHLPVELPSGLHWNVAQIWAEILKGLGLAADWSRSQKHEIVSVGCDAWGVDWALLDPSGELVALPHAYRDPRNPQYYEEAISLLGVDRIYQTTGIQMMAINSLYSLLAMVRTSPRIVESAERLLFIPDLIHYWLSGVRVSERTIASTSQMLDVRTGSWSSDLLRTLEIPERLMGEIVPAGTDLGPIRSKVAVATSLSAGVRVIAPGSHDTASAVVAVPARGDRRWCYLSSGTWSLLGVELERACTNPAAQSAMFTNEAGICTSIRFLKNIAGLWLVQECRRAWAKQGLEFTYQKLTELAEAATGIKTLIDPAATEFQQPGNMPEKIAEYARRTGQVIPSSPGEFVRCCLESLAEAYAKTLWLLESTLQQRFEVLHIVGGGSQNRLLNELTATATQREVIVGPLEATALGNGLVQAMSCGELQTLSQLRELVSRGN